MRGGKLARNCNSGVTTRGGRKLLSLREPPKADAPPDGIGVLDHTCRAYALKQGLLEDLSHPVILYLASIDARSRKTQIDALRIVALKLRYARVGDIDWASLGRSPMRLQLLHAAMREHPPNTANKVIYVVRSVLRACVRLRKLARDDYDTACEILKCSKAVRLRVARHVDAGELARLFAAAARHDAPAHAARDCALLAILFGGGLRREEACALDVSSWDGASLRFVGKGNKERVVPLPPDAARAVSDWLAIRGRAAGPLLLTMTRYGWRHRFGRLSTAGIYACVKRLARLAGIATCSPHDFRASYISEMLDLTDAVNVATLVGHSSVTTTMAYDRRPARARAAAVEKLRVPYRTTEAADGPPPPSRE